MTVEPFLNPQLAAMQVHGGMFMGIGYGVSEQLLIDEKTGRPLNGTLLDYKMMTMMDTSDLTAEFVELNDPMGPYGNKAPRASLLQFQVHRPSGMLCFMQLASAFLRFL